MEQTRVMRAALLEEWSCAAWDNGIQIESLRDMDRVSVHTENSVYEITIISPGSGEVLIRGGQFFPELTKAHIAGSSMGGSFLKLRGIYVAFNLEIHSERNTVMTSRVRKIVVE